jgi:hypothetical protein
MLGGSSRRSLRNKSRRKHADDQIICLSESERVASVIKMARAKLTPFAATEYPWNGMLNFNNAMPKEYIELGMGDGVGVMLKMAILELSEDGTVTDAILAKFELEGEKLMDALQGCVLNYTVLDSLILTIFVSLVVLHAGGNAYTVGANDVAQRLGDPTGAHSAWADLATFLSPEDATTQEAIRRVTYCCEYIGLAIGTLLCSVGLWETLFFYQTVSTGLPSVVSKCEFIIDYPKRLTFILNSFGMALVFLLLTLPFVVARSSAIASIISLAVGLLWWAFDCRTFGSRRGQVAGLMLAQHREAQRILARPQGRADGCEPLGGSRGDVEQPHPHSVTQVVPMTEA